MSLGQTQKLKEVMLDLEKSRQMERIKNAEAERIKELYEKSKKKCKEVEEEQEELVEKIHNLKKEKAALENQLLMAPSGNSADRSDFEKTKLKERVEILETKLEKKRGKI